MKKFMSSVLISLLCSTAFAENKVSVQEDELRQKAKQRLYHFTETLECLDGEGATLSDTDGYIVMNGSLEGVTVNGTLSGSSMLLVSLYSTGSLHVDAKDKSGNVILQGTFEVVKGYDFNNRLNATREKTVHIKSDKSAYLEFTNDGTVIILTLDGKKTRLSCHKNTF